MRKQFPLTSIVNIIYKEKEYPCAFILEFQKSEILLEAHDERDCKLWVKTITKGAQTIVVYVAIAIYSSCMYMHVYSSHVAIYVTNYRL